MPTLVLTLLLLLPIPVLLLLLMLLPSLTLLPLLLLQMLTGCRPWAGVPTISLFALVGEEQRALVFPEMEGVAGALRVSEGEGGPGAFGVSEGEGGPGALEMSEGEGGPGALGRRDSVGISRCRLSSAIAATTALAQPSSPHRPRAMRAGSGPPLLPCRPGAAAHV